MSRILSAALLMGSAALMATEAAQAAAAPSTQKSIIGAKYRDGRYKEPDWLGKLINDVCVTKGTKDKKVAVEGEEGAFKTIQVETNDGVDVDALFKLARENGLDAKVEKFEAQRDGHGFSGRFRMTVRNMLQAVAKQRHGIVVGGKFQVAPAEWLEAKDAPKVPTHTPEGEKIAQPKPTKPAEAPADNAGAEAPTDAPKAKPAKAAKAK